MYFKGFKDLIYNILNQKVSKRYKIARTLCRIESFRDKYAKEFGKNNPTLDDGHTEDGVILEHEYLTYVNGVKEIGFQLGLSLSDDLQKQLISYCDNTKFAVDRDENNLITVKYNNLNNPLKTGHIYSKVDPHLDSKLINSIATDSRLLNIAKEYLGCEPRLMTTQFWYTFPNKEMSEHHNFSCHIDLDDVKFLKLFFYLDDVNESTGPHIILAKTISGYNTLKFFNRQLPEKYIKDNFKNEYTIMTALKGQGFFEDTYAYHGGTAVAQGRRLLFQIEYGVSSREELNFSYIKSIANE